MTRAVKTVVIVGGGFSGATFGLKLHRQCPDWRIIIAEPKKRLGRGIAYGACGPDHLLNVPVSRMEIGLKPTFAEWLQQRRASIAEALVESGLDLAAAFVPRRLFGDYVEERVNEALDSKALVGLSSGARRSGAPAQRPSGRAAHRRTADQSGHRRARHGQSAAPPAGRRGHLDVRQRLLHPDPWAMDAFSDVDPAEPVLLIGSGLTTVDIALRLAQQGHRGPMLAVSRPRPHAADACRGRHVARIPSRQDSRLGTRPDQTRSPADRASRVAGHRLAAGVRRRAPRGAGHLERLERIQPPPVPASSAPALGHSPASHGAAV